MHNSDDWYDDKEVEEAVSRYEASKLTGGSQYFDVDEYLMIIDYYMVNDRQDEAIEACAKAMRLHGDEPELVLMRARIDIHQGNAEKALESILPLENMLSDDYGYYLTKASALLDLERDGFDECFEKVFELIEDESSELREDIFDEMGEMLERARLYPEARSFYEMAVEEFPENLVFLFKLGFCYECLSKPEKAIELYNKAIDVDPFSESAWYNIGIAYNRMGEYDKALEAYNYAIALDPSFSDAIFNRGNTFCNAGRYSEALECYQEYLQIYPDSVSAKCYSGECYIQLGRIDEADECYNKILSEHGGNNAEAWYGKAMVFSARGETKKAIEALETLLKIDNEHDTAWFHLGRLYFMLERNHDAIEAFEESLKLNKYNSAAWQNLALLLIMRHEYGEAIERLETALEFFLPDDSTLLYTLAAAEFLAGNVQSCMHDFKKAFNSDPDMIGDFLSLVPKSRMPIELKKLCNQNRKRVGKRSKDNNQDDNKNIDENEQH